MINIKDMHSMSEHSRLLGCTAISTAKCLLKFEKNRMGMKKISLQSSETSEIIDYVIHRSIPEDSFDNLKYRKCNSIYRKTLSAF
jgi:U3 small nucleolar ribonucleoprotein component